MSSSLPPTDAELVERSQKRDPDAFRTLIGRHEASIKMMITSVVGTSPDAEDIAQETITKAWNGIKSLKEPRAFRSWIKIIARNTAINHLKKSGRAKHTPFDEEINAPDQTESDFTDRLADSIDLSDSEWIIGDDLVSRALSLLTLEHRQILILRIVYGYTYEQLADELDIPAGTVGSRLKAAKFAFALAVQKLLGEQES